ncbi:MAG: hypothetical protein ONB44_07895 [candidate division KSB1 bacterium]|nr:hypothetical protein [candidate division KSB1 bacterium]MDZ7302049.1 hypothetical protein [candidate division KSB1 bacterium]MDZ7311091.1 hypothetical protein [candidate division KSB1 bacterium]
MMKLTHLSLIVTTGTLFTAMFFASPAVAQQQPAPQPPVAMPQVAASDTLPAPVIDEKGKNVRIFLDKVEVLGSIAKPQALFIIPGSDPKVDGIQIDRSFFREIFRPMEKDRFPLSSRSYPRGHIPW